MQAIICQTIDFVKESFVWDSLAMTSLCGVNAGHIWSNYFGRKQLSVILKGEGFQLINLLNSLLLRPVLLTLCCPVCVSEDSFSSGEQTTLQVAVQELDRRARLHLCAGDFRDLKR